jgi:thiol-disulfide isomerase/thioredoxin
MKRLSFSLTILIISLQTVAQTNIQLIVKNQLNHKIDKVDAFDISQVEAYNYTYKDTLNLAFKKTLPDCYNFRYHENEKMYRQQIWLDTGHIKIEAHLDSSKLVIDTVINSPIFYTYKNYAAKCPALYKANDTVALNNFLLDSYLNNIDNPFSLLVGDNYIGLNQNSKFNLNKLKTLTNKQGDKFKWHFLYERVNKRLDNILSMSKLNLSEFTFVNKLDKKTKLVLKGADYYILDFWFLACAPCIRDHQDIKRNALALKRNKVEIIGISIDDSPKKWKDYLALHNYNWQNYLQGNQNTITDELSIASFPTYIVLDKTGRITASYNSFADIMKRFGIVE